MAEKKILKGNRLEKIEEVKDGKKCHTGYRIRTGPLGTEGDESSFCGDARTLEFPLSHFEVKPYPQGFCHTNPNWSAWLLEYESLHDESEGECEEGFVCYPESQGKHLPPPSLSCDAPSDSNQDPSRPGSFYRKQQKG